MPEQEEFEVELPDGTIVVGPTQEAALAGARRLLAQNKLKSIQPMTSREMSRDPNKELQNRLEKENKFQRPDLYNELNTILGKSIPLVRSAASGAVGAAAGVASGHPAIGSFAMGATDELLRTQTGEKSGTILTQQEPSVIPRAIESGITNELLGRILSGIFKGGKEIVDPGSLVDSNLMKLRPTSGQATGSKVLQTIENFAPSARRAASVESHELINKEAQQLIEQYSGRTNISLVEPFAQMKNINARFKKLETLDKIIDNPISLRKFLLRGKPTRKADVQAYELTRLFNNASEVDAVGNTFFNGTKLQNLFKDPVKQESYKELFNSANRADIDQFFKNIAKVEEKGPLGMSPYWVMRLTATGITLPPAILAGMQSGSFPLGSGAFIAGTVGLNQLGKLLTKPTTARLMVAMANQGPLSMPSRIAGRTIGNALKNTTIELTREDGTKVPGKINANGQIELDK